MSLDSGLHIDVEAGLAVIRIDRPARRNALSLDLLRQLPTVLDVAVTSGARCVIITGGADLFSAGFDLSDLPPGGPDDTIEQTLRTAFDAVRNTTVPVLAAVEGACMGAGVELALACDLRIVSRDAFFEVPALRLGIRYRPDGIAAVARRFGPQVAMRLFGLGERLSGEAAAAAGIASHTCEAGAALALATDLAAILRAADPDLATQLKAAVRS